MTEAPAVNSSLQQRIRGGAIFGFVVMEGVFLGGRAFQVLMIIAASIGVFEWARMMRGERKYRVLYTFFGMVYIIFSCALMAWIRGSDGAGLYNILTLLFIVWASDISAYFAGRAIGGPKLAPAISPKKTWAGFAGSSLGAALVAAGLACPRLISEFGVFTVGDLSVLGYALMGAVLAAIGQVGDLFISIFKRRYNVKDTGSLIPGHGGVLDRIDALMLVAVAFSLVVLWFK